MSSFVRNGLIHALYAAAGLWLAAATSTQVSYGEGLGGLAAAALLLGFLNAGLRPLLILFALPFVLLTLGLGILVINALLVYLASWFVVAFQVGSFWAALWAGFLVSVVSVSAGLFRRGRWKFSILRPLQQPSGEGPSGVRKQARGGARREEEVIDI